MTPRLYRPPLAALLAFCPALTAQDPTPRSAAPDAARQGASPGGDQGSAQGDGPPRLVVTASGFAEETLPVPYTFQTLDQQQFRENAYRTLPEALQDVPGVMVQKTAHGHGSPYIRGFTGRQNLILIDGIRFNNSAFRGGPVQYWNTVDPYAIDRIEVIKSQGSVLYGSDAAGGTVNLLTRKADFRGERDGAFFHHGAAETRIDSNGPSMTGRFEAQVGEGGSFGLHVGGTWRSFGDIADSALGEMPQTGYDEFGYDLRLDVATSERTTLTAVHQRVEQDDIWRTHRTVDFEPWHGTSLSGPDLRRIYDQERDLTYVRFAGEETASWLDQYAFTVSWQHSVEDFDRTRLRSGNTEVQLDETRVETLGVALSMESPIGDEGAVVYGADWYRDDVDSNTNVFTFDPSGNLLSQVAAVQGPVGDDATYDLFGVFAQARVPVDDAIELTFGGRYTYAKADIGVIDDGAGNPTSAERSWDEATFNVRASVAVADDCRVYGGVSQAFRAPNVDDLSALKSSRTDLISTGSLDVDPEQFLTYEVGTRYEGRDATAQGSVYYTDLTDQITSTPVGTVPGTGEIITAATNGSDGWLWGAELEAAWRFDPQWEARGFVAYVDGEADTFPSGSSAAVREPLSRLMPLTTSGAVRWTQDDDHLWVECRASAAARAGRLNSGDRADTSRFPPSGTPGYFVLDLTSGFRASDNVEILFAIENVTDTAYRYHGSGVNQPGINVILGGRLTW
ncbi:MAG: TonB-dependent receptor plug domain-containing protein [Planctomycetota bacterium]